MNKRTKNLMIMIGICVICFGAYGISMAVQSGGKEEEPEKKAEMLWNISSEDITDISYVYNENEAVELSCSDGKWEYEKDDTFALNQTMAGDMADALAGAEILQKIDEADVDLFSFGLEVPSMTIDFQDAEGIAHSLAFGNYNTAAEACYAQKEDDNSVYMISADVMSAFKYELYDLLVLDTIPSVSADCVSGVEVSRDGNIYEYTYQIEEKESSEEVVWYVSKNRADYVNDETDEELSYTLRFGGNDGDGGVYMTVGDSCMVQIVSENTVNEIFGE